MSNVFWCEIDQYFIEIVKYVGNISNEIFEEVKCMIVYISLFQSYLNELERLFLRNCRSSAFALRRRKMTILEGKLSENRNELKYVLIFL